MENSRPQYTRPVIVDMDEPDGPYASGACSLGSGASGVCNQGNSPSGQQCKTFGFIAGNCNTGLIQYSCGGGSGV